MYCRFAPNFVISCLDLKGQPIAEKLAKKSNNRGRTAPRSLGALRSFFTRIFYFYFFRFELNFVIAYTNMHFENKIIQLLF